MGKEDREEKREEKQTPEVFETSKSQRPARSLRWQVWRALIIAFVAALPLVGTASYEVLKKNVEDEAMERARLYLTTMEQIRKHIGQVTRPAVMDRLPGTFFPEAMSTSFAARSVSERVQKDLPEYVFRHASGSPRNALNQADDFETNLVAQFKADRATKELSGLTTRPSGQALYIAKPVVSDRSCLSCHGAPDTAPKEVLEKYGTRTAFRWAPDQVVASLIVYVPTSEALANAWRAVRVFLGLFTVIFLIIALLVDRMLVRGMIRPIRRMATTADAISVGHLNRSFEEPKSQEMRMLASAFTRMQFSLKSAMGTLKKKP